MQGSSSRARWRIFYPVFGIMAEGVCSWPGAYVKVGPHGIYKGFGVYIPYSYFGRIYYNVWCMV